MQICATAKMFLRRCVRPKPMAEREPAFSWSTRLIRSASAAGTSPAISRQARQEKRKQQRAAVNAGIRPARHVARHPFRHGGQQVVAVNVRKDDAAQGSGQAEQEVLRKQLAQDAESGWRRARCAWRFRAGGQLRAPVADWRCWRTPPAAQTAWRPEPAGSKAEYRGR